MIQTGQEFAYRYEGNVYTLTTMRESDVIMTLSARQDIDIDRLETNMCAVIDAVEEHASDVALGAVVAANLKERSIELAFNLCHESEADAQEKIHQVVSVIENYALSNFGVTDFHKSAAADRESDTLDLVC